MKVSKLGQAFVSAVANLVEAGDAMVRELDFSEITLRLVEHSDKKGEGNDDHVIAKLKGPTLDTLRRCLVSLLSTAN